MIMTGEFFKAWNSCYQVKIQNSSFSVFHQLRFLNPSMLSMQHPYVYGVLIFEAMATFVGQVSVLSLIAIFGAATTAMVGLCL